VSDGSKPAVEKDKGDSQPQTLFAFKGGGRINCSFEAHVAPGRHPMKGKRGENMFDGFSRE
jgi:hypothetical protein